MAYPWQESQQAYREAAAWFQTTLAEVNGRWGEPGLGEWDIRSLVGHTSRSLLTVEAYLKQPAAAVMVGSPVAYYLATHDISAGAGVAQRGRDAGQALGGDPEGAVARIAARVLALTDGLTGSELLTTIVGGMRLADYLPTRVLELTVHTADLATALSLPVKPPALPASLTLTLLCDLVVARDEAGPLLLAATGRGHLPEGYSVL